MQIQSKPWLRSLYLTMLLPITMQVLAVALIFHAFHQAVVSTRMADLLLAAISIGMGIKCWTITLEFARNMRRFLEALWAVKRGDLVLSSTRAGLPEIEDLAKELNGMNETPDTSLAKWILLSRDHQAIFVRLVEAMSASMRSKSFYARGHSGRVAEYSTLICEEMGLPAEKTQRIRLSALLHDIGKIGMDQNILTKPTGLTASEFEILKTHPTRGAEMLRPVAEFADLLPGVELHHESFDGSGYPHGLKGDQIPQMARIIAVADTFDAMTHNRTYQDAMEGPYALRIIQTMVGKKLDEKAVAAFCHAYAAGKVVLPKKSPSSEDDSLSSPPPKAEPVRAPRETVEVAAASTLVGASK
jgi:putative nucleotidyltransferase with HDIG domain